MSLKDFKLKNVIDKYSHFDYETNLKVRFAYYLCVSMIFLMIPVIIYTIFIFDHFSKNVFSNSIIIISEFLMAFFFTICLYILSKGYFRLASHLIFISGFSIFWFVMCLDKSSLVIRLDTVTYLLAIIATLPLFFDKWKTICRYSCTNLLLLFLYTWLFHSEFTEEITDFFVDSTISILLISVTSYHILSIKNSLLKKARTEIQKLKNAEEVILSEKERLQVTLQSIGDGVITTDTDGNVIIINKIAQKLTGWSQTEAFNQPLSAVFRIVNKTTGERCKDPVEKVLQSGKIHEFSNYTVLISRNGNERIIADSGSPIRNSIGKTIGVVLVFRDMTEKQKLIDTAQKSQKLQSLGTLAGGIAHDFNNLLTGIYGMIGFAKEESDKENVKRMLSEAGETIDRARSLSHQLLTFAKGGVPVKKLQSIDVFLTDFVKFSLSGSNISSSFSISDDLNMIEYDKNQISQVIDNIILNAVQAMPKGGRIIVTAENKVINQKDPVSLEPGNYIKISIGDNGPGISQKHVANIFDPFFTTKKNGQGLGLAMCYSIIKKHNGVISVDTQLEKGSIFTILLPASNRVCQKSNNKSDTSLLIGNGNFLIMDDDPIVKKVTEKIVQQLGFQTTAVSNGQEAVNEFFEAHKSETPFDIILFDLTIQDGMGGIEAIKKIREIDSNVIAFVCTGYSEDPVIARPSEFGFTDSISKPFSANELKKKLRTIL